MDIRRGFGKVNDVMCTKKISNLYQPTVAKIRAFSLAFSPVPATTHFPPPIWPSSNSSPSRTPWGTRANPSPTYVLRIRAKIIATENKLLQNKREDQQQRQRSTAENERKKTARKRTLHYKNAIGTDENAIYSHDDAIIMLVDSQIVSLRFIHKIKRPMKAGTTYTWSRYP